MNLIETPIFWEVLHGVGADRQQTGSEWNSANLAVNYSRFPCQLGEKQRETKKSEEKRREAKKSEKKRKS